MILAWRFVWGIQNLEVSPLIQRLREGKGIPRVIPHLQQVLARELAKNHRGRRWAPLTLIIRGGVIARHRGRGKPQYTSEPFAGPLRDFLFDLLQARGYQNPSEDAVKKAMLRALKAAKSSDY